MCHAYLPAMAKRVEELLVYQKALEASDEISDLLKSEAFAKDLRLRSQIGASSERVVSVISEGFEQKTDRHFASYLYTARGSSAETRTQLRIAERRGYVTSQKRLELDAKYEEIKRMLTGLIRHLEKENRKHRGRLASED
jgi:four helix bundle protein